MIKPMLADDWVEAKQKWPAIWQPKIDGVRGLNMDGRLTGRSLRQHNNEFTTAFYSRPEYMGFDGELACGSALDPALCRKTTSALNTYHGEPSSIWWLFDYITAATMHLSYKERLFNLEVTVRRLQAEAAHESVWHLRVIPGCLVVALSEFEDLDAQALRDGYEGSILRDPHGMHKQGRSTVREGGLMRIKRFVEEEAVVHRIIEGRMNNNEATTNLLGNTERSTHAENMVPNGMVGSLECVDVKTRKPITVSAGSMPHSDRERYFNEPKLLIGETIKYKTFPKGVKDLPRFPTFQSVKMASDR